MSDGTFRELAVRLRRAARKQFRAATRGVLDDGGRLIAGRGNLAGVWQPGDGGTGHDRGAEPPLGDPPAHGYLLSSTPDGERRWVPLLAGAGITVTVNPTTGAITIGTTLALDTLIFDGDDLIFGGDLIGFAEA